MNKPSKKNTRKFPALIPVLAGLAVLMILFTVGGFAFAASQESHDAFCASCHTQPEATFFDRSTGSQAVDLASFHTTQDTRCIDCHSGAGINGRVQAELMGASNAVKWFTGTAVQPAPLTVAISNENCLKCHKDVIKRGFVAQEQISVPGARAGRREREDEGGNGHWHTFMTRWEAATPTAGTCIDCHAGHETGSTAENGFMNAQNVRATCEACHRAIRRDED